MSSIHRPGTVAGTTTPTTHTIRSVPLLWWLLVVLGAVLTLLFALPARGAIVSGDVTIPTSDGGYRPAISNADPAKVRVEGTSLETSVVATTRYTGTFTLVGVPAGPVTLIYVETPGEDSFTMDSRRLAVNVAGDVSGLQFNLRHHWQNLPSYPPPWFDRASYDIWEPYWVSAKIGFILFLNRGVSPHETELWRTITGGSSWKLIGHWTHATGTVHPDITGRSMLFADGSHGVITAGTSVNFGMLRTADGGTTWTVIDLPNTPNTNGIASVQNYAKIDSTRWIACGPENTGTYMGAGSPVTMTVWETADAGATWAIKRMWYEDYAGCSAVDADKSGRAVLFSTPYAWGGGLHREIRSTAGTWTNVAVNNIVTNSGYGSADIPMVGSEVWVRASSESPTGPGLFKSTDFGETFTEISEALPQYMDFVSSYKGFAPAGGPLHATYDGGLTWLKQSGGGGICCHGNYVWAFDTMHAVWKDGGVGDPNGVADVLTLVEPRVANFEVLPGVALPPAGAAAGDSNVAVLSLRFVNQGPMPLKVTGLGLKGSGTGNELLDVAAVKAWWDRNANGAVDPTDTLLASGSYPADNGELTLNLGSKYPAQPRLPYDVLVTYDFAGYVARSGRFVATVTPASVTAQSADTGATLTVAATTPVNTQITSGQASLAPSTVALSSVSLSTSLVSGCKSVTGTVTITEPAPAAGLLISLSDTINAATVSATVTVPSGAASKAFTVTTAPVAVNESGTVNASLGLTTLGAPLTVRPMGMSLVSLSPVSVVGGNTVSGTARLECAAGPGQVTVHLASANGAVAHPATATINVPVGATSAPFQVVTTAVGAKSTASISATVNGVTKSKSLTVTPAAAVSPTSLKFGSVPVGTTSGVLNATLTNRGVTAFPVNSIGITGTYASWFAQTNNCPANLPAGASCTIGVTFKPAATATKLAKLSIATGATSTPLSVSLSGTGT
jgi:hypothetical protein